MALNIEIDNITLDILTGRLKNVVSPLDIIKWLGNFKKEEVPIAIDLLSNLTVYNTFEIEEVLNINFTSIEKTAGQQDRIIVHPVGKFGKSGSMVSYFFQKTNFYKAYKTKISLVPVFDDIQLTKKGRNILVLLDDFVGTGKTIETYYKKFVEPQEAGFSKIYFTGIAGMRNGIKKIYHYFDKIFIPKSNRFYKAFSNNASYFGYRKFYGHRDLAYEYGVTLTTPVKLKNGNEKYVHALGYENSQALIAFSYGCPNNTLPIIYSNTENWVPLIPRFSDDKINMARSFRKTISYELAVLKEFGGDNLRDNFFSLQIKRGSKEFSSVNHIDFSIYAIIKLTRSGYTSVSICQRLGIMHHDYEKYLEFGKKRGIFSDGNKMTLFGLELYYDAKKCIDMRRKSLEYAQADRFSVRNINYIPKTFNGRS